MIPLIPAAISRRVRVAVDSTLPDRPVLRRIHGVELVVPRRQGLANRATPGAGNGRTVIDLARRVASAEDSMVMLDVGAGVGEVALGVLQRATGHVVCVEPDPLRLQYLEANVRRVPEVSVERSSLVPAEGGGAFGIAGVDADWEVDVITTEELLERHPHLGDVRLIITDTDGFEILLAPALARTFAASRPVLHLAFDPAAAAVATPDVDPADLWRRLAELGYQNAVIWENSGTIVGPSTVSGLVKRTAELQRRIARGHKGSWRVAVAHRDDRNGRAALARSAMR